ncbi:MAG: CYTH domain-containing protein [Bacteroidales bacterium]|nr:MAG: CYTH domain-containing protein [Bacteroidales bacterium]
MGKEIERKFLVNTTKWVSLEKPIGDYFRQGYLLNTPEKTVRIRQTGTKGFITIKGSSIGATRAEFEFEIPKDEANEILDTFVEQSIIKNRFKITFGGKVWEIDEFLGDNQGLIIAEIELFREDEQFGLPDWIESEVTHEQKYYNANLINNPYKNWQNKE